MPARGETPLERLVSLVLLGDLVSLYAAVLRGADPVNVSVLDWLKAQPRKVPLVAGVSTAFGCSIDGVVPTAKTVAMAKGLADAGVDQIMPADTVGYAHPAQIKEVVRATRDAPAARMR